MDNTEENFHNAAEDILYNLQHTYNCEPAAAACILLIALGRMGGMSHFEKVEQAWEHMTDENSKNVYSTGFERQKLFEECHKHTS